ncbi:MAG: NAD metabolism ATPase/kinase [Planctomycetaceae bacterium]|nr:NAD metabolism ATPase/kinase [Planctomycetaceae bacterium]
MIATTEFSKRDLEQLEAAGIGISVQEAEQQLELLSQPPDFLELAKPCTTRDGIVQLNDEALQTLIQKHRESVVEGRWTKFVPASGAASRMFVVKKEEDKRKLCQRWQDLAFADALADFLGQTNDVDYEGLEAAMLGGLGLDKVPKGLIPFHRYDDSSRVPFEEHLLEASTSFCDRDKKCSVHFTVSEEHQGRFEELLKEVQDRHPDVTFDVTFSIQKPSTNTLALSESGPVRKNNGSLVLRPGGHGALIENVEDVNADCVFIKNIDNVTHESQAAENGKWIEALCGYLVSFQAQIHEHLQRLDSDRSESSIAAAEQFVSDAFPGQSIQIDATDAERYKRVYGILNRPVRICGMVQNEGEPGGGPFWQRHEDGSLSVQIVESVEVNDEDKQQAAIASDATHFNPVFMALGLRDHRGDAFSLADYIDTDRYILNQKVVEDVDATILERPGLWNGSMGKWNSVFVEVPIAVFNPVKSVIDLLRPAHQPT